MAPRHGRTRPHTHPANPHRHPGRVERRIPRRERRTPPAPTPDGGEEELEIRRARAEVAHVLRDWLPRTLALQDPEPEHLLQQAERMRETAVTPKVAGGLKPLRSGEGPLALDAGRPPDGMAYSHPHDGTPKGVHMKMDEPPEWNKLPRTARDICLQAFGLAVSAKRIREKQHESWRASQRDFIGREIGEAADAMLEAYQKTQTPLDLARELENLLEMTRP